MSRQRALGLLLLAAMVCAMAPRTARAEIDSPEVRAGLAALEALDYPRAVELLDRARGQQLTVEELGAALRGLGMAHAALGQDAAAVGVFEALLRLAPDTHVDRTVSPRIRGLFEEARARIAASAPPASPAPPPSSTPPATSPPTPAAPPPAAPPIMATPSAPPSTTPPVVPPQALQPTTDEAAASGQRPVWRRGWFWGVVGGVALAALAGGLVGGLLSRDGTLVISTR